MNLFALWGLRHLIVECYKWSSDVVHFERSLCLAFSLHAVPCRGMLLAAVKQVGSSIWGSGVLGFWKRPEQGSLSSAYTVQAGTQSTRCYGDRWLSEVDRSHRQNLSWGPGTLLSRKYARSWAELLFLGCLLMVYKDVSQHSPNPLSAMPQTRKASKAG